MHFYSGDSFLAHSDPGVKPTNVEDHGITNKDNLPFIVCMISLSFFIHTKYYDTRLHSTILLD